LCLTARQLQMRFPASPLYLFRASDSFAFAVSGAGTDRPRRPRPAAFRIAAMEEPGTVQWFNAGRGYGFIQRQPRENIRGGR
jgi:hypothetical protein